MKIKVYCDYISRKAFLLVYIIYPLSLNVLSLLLFGWMSRTNCKEDFFPLSILLIILFSLLVLFIAEWREVGAVYKDNSFICDMIKTSPKGKTTLKKVIMTDSVMRLLFCLLCFSSAFIMNYLSSDNRQKILMIIAGSVICLHSTSGFSAIMVRLTKRIISVTLVIYLSLLIASPFVVVILIDGEIGKSFLIMMICFYALIDILIEGANAIILEKTSEKIWYSDGDKKGIHNEN